MKDKELLIKDLCARLPYGVKFQGEDSNVYTLDAANYFALQVEDVVFKPYLRSMSSMTDDEREDWYRQSKVDYDCEFKPEPTLSPEHCHLSIDWLNKYGFDYRGLIEMGLAFEAPEEMYKNK